MAKDSYEVLSLPLTPGKTAKLDFMGFRFDPKVKCVSLKQAGEMEELNRIVLALLGKWDQSAQEEHVVRGGVEGNLVLLCQF